MDVPSGASMWAAQWLSAPFFSSPYCLPRREENNCDLPVMSAVSGAFETSIKTSKCRRHPRVIVSLGISTRPFSSFVPALFSVHLGLIWVILRLGFFWGQICWWWQPGSNGLNNNLMSPLFEKHKKGSNEFYVMTLALLWSVVFWHSI